MNFWSVPKIWKNGECWILGGGPSITEQFEIPKDVVEGVKSGRLTPSAYSPYMEYLHDKHVIGVNMAFRIGTWIDIIYFGDSSFYRRAPHELTNYPGLVVNAAYSPVHAKPGVKLLKKATKNRVYGISTNPSEVCWNGNSGASAINIAVHTGVKKIYLLGFDMNAPEKDNHWHKLYGQQKRQPPFQGHLRGFPTIKKHADQLGIEIINVCPASAIQEFRKVSMKEVMQ